MAVIKKTSAIKNSPKHLLGIQNLSILEAQKILNEAKAFIKLNKFKLTFDNIKIFKNRIYANVEINQK